MYEIARIARAQARKFSDNEQSWTLVHVHMKIETKK